MLALESAFFVGLGVVALWIYLRYPRLRPRSLVRAVVHVGISFGLFSLVPYAVVPCKATFPPTLALLVIVVGLVVPTLGYVLLSWIWLIVKIHDLGNSLPRGGHRIHGSKA